MIKIPVPDYIKSLLVDDWEEVTKNLSLIPLPAPKPANMIIDEYFDEEKEKRFPGSAEMDLLEEVRAGLKEYFDVALGRTLLYRFERQQYKEAIKAWTEGKGEWKGRTCAGDVYGAEHLCRMIGMFSASSSQVGGAVPLTCQNSPATRDDCANEHGWAIRQSLERGDDQVLAVAESKYPDLLHGGI